MAGSSLFANLARGAKLLALLLFFLPWVTVSCSTEAMQRIQSEARGVTGQVAPPTPGLNTSVPIAQASGLNMALGSLQLMNPAAGLGPAGPQQQAAEPPALSPEIGVIAGAALILLALVGSILLKGTAGAAIGIGGSLLAIGALCYSVFVHYPPTVIAALAAGRNGGGELPAGGGPSTEQIAQILSVKPQAVFFIVLVLLAVAVVLNVLAMKKAAPPAASAF